MRKQRSKSQRARRNDRRRYRKLVKLFSNLAVALSITEVKLRVFAQRYILAFDGARPDSFLVYDTKTDKIVSMNTTTKDNDDE